MSPRAYYRVDERQSDRCWMVCTSAGMESAASIARGHARDEDMEPIVGLIAVAEVAEGFIDMEDAPDGEERYPMSDMYEGECLTLEVDS